MPSGAYHFVLDCIVIAPVDVKFELMARHGTDTVVLATWSKHFDPLATGYDAQPYEVDMTGAKIDFVKGDKLVFKFSGANTIQSDAWIPNGDGGLSQGRIPNLTLP